MPVLQVQDEFQSGDNVTATNLNDLVNEASFASGAVDNSTLQVASAGHLKVKDNGILSNHLKSDASNDSVRAVTTNHIRNDAVTYAKIQNVTATDRVLGRNSTGAGNVEEITPAALRTMINVEDGATADQSASEIKTAYESNNNTNAFTDADVTKLSGIETGATADQTASEIKIAYESNADTNVFTDADVTKLNGIEAGATGDQTASEIKTAYESNGNTNAFTDAEKSKLTGIEAGATADQSASEIKTAYESNTNTNAFTDAEKSKLTGIAAGAEVNVQSDWTATSGDAFIKNKPTIPTDNTELANGAGYTTNTGTVTSVTGSGGITGSVTTSGSLSLANLGVTTAKLADNAVTSAKISSSDTTFNVHDTNNNIGTGALADASYQLTVDGGTVKDPIYAKGNQAQGYVDFDLENESSTGLGGRVIITQGSNSASFQYQESDKNATLNVVDGSLTANAGIRINCDSASKGQVFPTGSMRVGNNTNVDLGTSSSTWDNGYIDGGAWTGSDRNLKQDIEDLSEAELRVATALKGLMKKFRLKASVVNKGEDARIHIGVIAQDVKAAFDAEGLDAYRYALIGEDTWWSKQDENGEWLFKNEETAGYTKHTKMSVRYEQLLAFIIAAL